MHKRAKTSAMVFLIREGNGARKVKKVCGKTVKKKGGTGGNM